MIFIQNIFTKNVLLIYGLCIGINKSLVTAHTPYAAEQKLHALLNCERKTNIQR